MDKQDMKIIRYCESLEENWDKFVTQESINGTFLHTRRFLNYHPKGRFDDFSYVIVDKNEKMIAAVPACLENEKDGKILYSHKGSTYGGIIISPHYYKVNKVLEILGLLEAEWRKEEIKKVVLKQTPSILSSLDADLFQYCFYYKAYNCCNELNFYIDFNDYSENVLSEFAQGKRTNVNNCIKQGFQYRRIVTLNEIQALVNLLEKNLEKYDRKPIHTAEEIYDFQFNRLKNECECFGIFDKEKMIAGAMMFYFNRAKVAHTQYLCADAAYNKLSPMTYMYYLMLVEARRNGFRKLTWGIGTEQQGRYLNESLCKSKEAYGSKHSVNLTYIKEL